MKRLLQTGCCLFFAFQAFAQNVTVPYRVGNTFGISDYKGKLLSKFRYDKITYHQRMPKGYFTFTDNDKKGLLYNEKPLISGAAYEDFSVEPDKFIIGKIRRNPGGTMAFNNEKEYQAYQQRQEGGYALFNLKGENIYPDNFKKLYPVDTAGVSSINPKRTRYALLSSVDYNKRYSLFVYDCDKQKISEWFLKDYSKIQINRGLSSSGSTISLTTVKDATSPLQAMKVLNENGKFVLLQPNKVGTERFGSAYERDPENEGYGTTERPMLTTEVTPPAYGTGVRNSARGSENESPKVVKKYYLNRFEIKEGKLFLEEKIVGEKENKSLTEFTMPPLPEGQTYTFSSINYGNTVLDNAEKRITQLNIIRFESGGLLGLLLSPDQLIPNRYTSIKPLRLRMEDDTHLLFIVGIKDEATQKIRYGVIDSSEKPVIPIQYEEIDPYALSRAFATKDELTCYNKYWRFKDNGKYGVIIPYNGILLPAEYDEIEVNGLHYSGHEADFISLKRNGLYGFVANGVFTEKNIIQPVFPYKVGFYDRNYQNQKGLLLLGLEESEGKFFCYARPDGFLYYKAK